MLDENLISTLEQSLRQTRNAQNRLMARLREAEVEVDLLRQEITALENSASQTESAIDSLLVTMRSGNRGLHAPRTIKMDDEYEIRPEPRDSYIGRVDPTEINGRRFGGSVSYINQHRGIPSIVHNSAPLSQRFSDLTITQACTLLLRDSGQPLHVNELYNLLVAGGMRFKGNNPTISIAVSLNRNRRFSKAGPGTFELVMREAERFAS